MKLIEAAEALWNFYNGKFGNKTLRYPYRRYWQCLWLIINIVLFIWGVMFPFFGWWDGIIHRLNHIIWG